MNQQYFQTYFSSNRITLALSSSNEYRSQTRTHSHKIRYFSHSVRTKILLQNIVRLDGIRFFFFFISFYYYNKIAIETILFILKLNKKKIIIFFLFEWKKFTLNIMKNLLTSERSPSAHRFEVIRIGELQTFIDITTFYLTH